MSDSLINALLPTAVEFVHTKLLAKLLPLPKKEEAEREARKRKELEDEIRARVEATQRELLAKQKAEVSDAERNKIQEELDKLNAKLDAERRLREEAEGKVGDLEQRILESERKRDTIASDPRGKIYIISNAGSFGEHVYKIGLTRREIEERAKELGDASVPFEHTFLSTSARHNSTYTYHH